LRIRACKNGGMLFSIPVRAGPEHQAMEWRRVGWGSDGRCRIMRGVGLKPAGNGKSAHERIEVAAGLRTP